MIAIPSRPGKLTLIELTERLRDMPPLEVWNVLTDEYFDGRLIPGSWRVPLDRVVRYARTQGLATDAEIVVYCSGPDCPQSQLAAEKLAGAGYINVRAFSGGLTEWSEAGLPLAQESAGTY